MLEGERAIIEEKTKELKIAQDNLKKAERDYEEVNRTRNMNIQTLQNESLL
jgi:hypothetical protein